MCIDWLGFENFIGEEFPSCLKGLLYRSGYSNFISLKEINESTIPKLETFINENLKDYINELKCCYSLHYRSQLTFTFLPGHEATLLALPEYIEKYIECVRSREAEQSGRLSFILEQMIATAESNLLKDKNGLRYPDSIRYFSTYIFLVCGRFCYEMLRSNLPMPSTKTILRCIDDNKSRIVEGKLRAKELSNYLDQMNCTKYVWLSEDATAIISKVVYDPSTNQLVGIVPPIDKTTGCSKILSFTATNAEIIKQHLLKTKSTVVYLVMAQPLDEAIPPFVLQMFGSDNKFYSKDVIKRWKYTVCELKKLGVTVAGWSSDGDPKLLSTMCYEIVHQNNEIQCIQDTTHIATKLRNRLLKPNIRLTMGTKKVAVSHLKTLVRNINKIIHGLNESDVCPIDRQNFRSFQKITSPRVIEALQMRIRDSEATVKYLQICDEITSSFLELELKPEDRIYRIHHALFFLRIWRNHIKSSRQLTLKDDFITHNAYTCIEINAQSMIALVKRFRNENATHLFLPPIFDSQTCEKTFRQLRSMGTMDFTRINFTLYDLLHMIGRIEVQNDITHFKLSETGVSFPATHKKRRKTKTYDLPTDSEIANVLEKAKVDAISDARKFEMNATDIDEFQFQSNVTFDDDGNDILEDDPEIVDDSLITPENTIDNDPSTENLNFTTVIDENGDERILRKSTLIWMLTEPGTALSNDRLRRVQVGKRKRTSFE